MFSKVLMTLTSELTGTPYTEDVFPPRLNVAESPRMLFYKRLPGGRFNTNLCISELCVLYLYGGPAELETIVIPCREPGAYDAGWSSRRSVPFLGSLDTVVYNSFTVAALHNES